MFILATFQVPHKECFYEFLVDLFKLCDHSLVVFLLRLFQLLCKQFHLPQPTSPQMVKPKPLITHLRLQLPTNPMNNLPRPHNLRISHIPPNRLLKHIHYSLQSPAPHYLPDHHDVERQGGFDTTLVALLEGGFTELVAE